MKISSTSNKQECSKKGLILFLLIITFKLYKIKTRVEMRQCILNTKEVKINSFSATTDNLNSVL